MSRPTRTTCSVTAAAGSPTAAATCWLAMIGLLAPNQISARSGRTSATQVCTSSGACGANAKSNVRSMAMLPSGGATNGGAAARSAAVICASESEAFGPPSHTICKASRAFCA